MAPETHAYVLMDNHYHLLVETPEPNLSRAMQWCNVSYSVWFNLRHQRSGHLLQGRFSAELVQDDAGWQDGGNTQEKRRAALREYTEEPVPGRGARRLLSGNLCRLIPNPSTGSTPEDSWVVVRKRTTTDSWHKECSSRPMNVCSSILPLEDGITDSKVRPFGKAQILIAEDDPTLAQDLKCKIENLDYEVAGITHSGEQAVVLAQSLRPDLVLMDIQLAGEMDGIQAAEQIRTLRVPLIYVSGYCDSPVLQRAQLTEPYGYVLKPYRTDDLRISVEMSLQRHRAEQEREQLLKRFHDVLASVKTLTGQLSICCYCKKIRDEAGNWPEIETYVMKHSDASFIHGMCPDCFTRVQKRIEAIEQVDAASGSVLLG